MTAINTDRPRKIGILRGMETTFPDALIPFINREYADRNVTAEFVMLDAVRMDADPGYDVILDRISHEVPFYRAQGDLHREQSLLVERRRQVHR